MKTNVIRVLTLIFALAFSCAYAQVKPGIGIATDNPTGALLHIANPDSVSMPSLRLDSIPSIPLSTLRYFLAVDTGGRIVGKVSANKDSLWNILGGKPIIIPEMIPWGKITYLGSGGGDPFTNYYRDNDSIMVSIRNGSEIVVSIRNKNPQIKNILSDFFGGSPFDLLIRSCIVLNSKLYILGLNKISGTRKLLQYDVSNISASPITITFTGSKVLANYTVPGYAPVDIHMTSDGNYFYFSHDCGNTMSSENLITKHSLSGTSLSYISTITLSSVTNLQNILVHKTKGIITKELSGHLKKFDFSGVNTFTVANFQGAFFINSQDNFYSTQGVENFYELFYIE